MFNTEHYEPPSVPSLFSVLSGGTRATDAGVYGIHTQPFVLEHNKVIEIVMKNKHMRNHPVHLHGHNFQIVQRSADSPYDAAPPPIPMRRDTIVIDSVGSLRIRFRADNPGV